jgi:hypothetical protein
MRAIGFLCLCLLSLTASCSAQKHPDVSTANGLSAKDLVGEWTGESKCTGNNPSCHDEIVRYRFSEIKDNIAKVHLAADKQVNGEWDLMGEFDFDIDAAKNTLRAEFTIPRTGGRGVWSFTVAGDRIDGTLTVYPENEIGRRVHLERKK